ncbi:hypothetical protein BBAD15_g7497 [Beauveria bassiana D1-5]|uniref:Uncharacterized protein n=1 Tax=Beauveria bassiana D1-5 TaxID=1245745 RepID=A0A0A2W2L7_BEABA|nr:hypothetical protein BBAD15_g7497 [Beauveria bassiana D1-5]
MATKTCGTCGVSHAEHDTENCQITPECANCHGPHHADFGQCYARPKKVGDTYHKLSKSQITHAKRFGTDDYRRRNMEVMVQSLDNRQAPNEAMTNSNVDEVDTDMADTSAEAATTTPQDDYLPALGEDEEMGDTEQQQPQNNAAVIQEDDEPERTEEIPVSQEQVEGGGNEVQKH